MYEKKLRLDILEFLIYLNISESVRMVVIESKTDNSIAKDIRECK